MRVKTLSFLAAILLVAACESPSETAGSGGSSGIGDAGGSAGGESYDVATFSPDPTSQDYLEVNIGDRVHFDFNQYNVRSDYAPVLEKQAEWMRQNPGVRVVIGGHCDERGTREYNLALGARRANAVRDFLISSGVSSDRILTISYGKERPAVPGSSEAAYAANRRAVTIVQ